MKEAINIQEEDSNEETPLTKYKNNINHLKQYRTQNNIEESSITSSDNWALALLSCFSVIQVK